MKTETPHFYGVTILLIVFFLLSVPQIYSSSPQNNGTIYSISAGYHQGAVLYDQPDKIYLINDFSRGCEINLIRRRFQPNVWESDFNRLEIGTGLWFGTFGNKQIFGEGIALKIFANYHIFEVGNFNAKYNISFGPAYVTKLFDPEQNLFDNSFSTHINAYSGIGFVLNYNVTYRVSLSGNFMFHHISNGSFSKPNNGVSILNAGFSAKYNLTPIQRLEYQFTGKTPSSLRELLFSFGMGANQALIINIQKSLSGSLSVAHLWYTNKTKAYGMGVDLIHIGGAPYVFGEVNDIDIHQKYSTSDNIYLGLFGIMESHLGSTSPFVAIGAYIYHKTEPRQPLYARIGFRQKVLGNLSFHYSIKLNFFSSEFMEFGLAYRVGWRK